MNDSWLNRMILDSQINFLEPEKIRELAEISKLLDLRQSILKPDFSKIDKDEFVKKLAFKFDNINLNDVSVTIGIMVKNQEDRILKCIKSCESFCDELIIMDTGSSDATVDLIKKSDSKKITIIQRDWENDFSKMRNILIDLTKTKWMLFIDSDEIIDKGCNPRRLKEALWLLDYLSKEHKVSVAIKQTVEDGTAFNWVERILRLSDGTRMFGKIHEEIRYEDLPITKVVLNLEVCNSGTTQEEIEKFNKSKLYSELAKSMQDVEPNNPKWGYCSVYISASDSSEKLIRDEQILKRVMLVDVQKKISEENFRESLYLHSIIQKYLSILLLLGDFTKILYLSEVAIKKFPNSSTLLFFKHLSKYRIFEEQKRKLFREYLTDLKTLDYGVSEEITQRNPDMLKSIGVKYLFDERCYKDAETLYSELRDSSAKKFLKEEQKYLQLLDQTGGKENES